MPVSVSSAINEDLVTVAGQARRLESLGFDAVSVGETRHNPFLPLVLVAEHTERMRFATSVAIAFPRVPHVTANLAWDLSAYSGGRFVLGLGSQVKAHNERRFSVPWEPPGPHLRDYVACMRAIWYSWQHGTRPAYEGEYYQYRLTGAMFNPGPIGHPEIPVIVSAGNAFNARLAGEICDGIAVHSFTSFRYMREVLIPALREGAESAGKDLSGMRVQGGGFIATGRTDVEVQDALAHVRREIAYYASTRGYAGLMRFHGWEALADDLRRLLADGRSDAMAELISDDVVDAFCVVGTWDDLPQRLQERVGGLVTEISLPVALTTRGSSSEEDEHLCEVVAAIQRIPSLGPAAGGAPPPSFRA